MVQSRRRSRLFSKYQRAICRRSASWHRGSNAFRRGRQEPGGLCGKQSRLYGRSGGRGGPRRRRVRQLRLPRYRLRGRLCSRGIGEIKTSRENFLTTGSPAAIGPGSQFSASCLESPPCSTPSKVRARKRQGRRQERERSRDGHLDIAEWSLNVFVPMDRVGRNDIHIASADAMRLAALNGLAAKLVWRTSFGCAADDQGGSPAHYVDDGGEALMAAPLGLAGG